MNKATRIINDLDPDIHYCQYLEEYFRCDPKIYSPSCTRVKVINSQWCKAICKRDSLIWVNDE